MPEKKIFQLLFHASIELITCRTYLLKKLILKTQTAEQLKEA